MGSMPLAEELVAAPTNVGGLAVGLDKLAHCSVKRRAATAVGPAASIAPATIVAFSSTTTAHTPLGKRGTRASTKLRSLLGPAGTITMREWL